MMAKLKGWRTIIFHALYGVPAAVILVLDYLRSVDLTQTGVSARTAAWVGIGVSIASIFLRAITTTPMGEHGRD